MKGCDTLTEPIKQRSQPRRRPRPRPSARHARVSVNPTSSRSLSPNRIRQREPQQKNWVKSSKKNTKKRVQQIKEKCTKKKNYANLKKLEIFNKLAQTVTELEKQKQQETSRRIILLTAKTVAKRGTKTAEKWTVGRFLVCKAANASSFYAQ